MKTYCVYIMASKRNGTLCIGMTNDLRRRVYEHKQGWVKGFTEKYAVHDLVYYGLARLSTPSPERSG
jgi:putative endonuclease